MKQFRYTIFDLDGTLLDSMPAWHNLGKNYLLHMGINAPDDLNEVLSTMTIEEAACYFQETFKIDLSKDKIIEEINKLIEENYKYKLKLKPFVREYLQTLKENKVKMCVATATPSSLAKDALKHNEVLNYFSFIISCDDIGAGKNKPDIFLMAANKLDAVPAEIAVYEDAHFAIKTAKDSGFYTIGIYDEFFSDKRKEIELISDKYIRSFKELL